LFSQTRRGQDGEPSFSIADYARFRKTWTGSTI
jgi:hypothetical protein